MMHTIFVHISITMKPAWFYSLTCRTSALLESLVFEITKLKKYCMEEYFQGF